jgi:NADH dehydrogenase FAD-containing subunit
MLAGTKAQFQQGWVTQILPEGQQVVVQTAVDRQHIPYDYLVIALGSRVDRESVSGVNEYAFTLDPFGARTTQALTQKLKSMNNPFRAVVVGGGATGIEAATQIKATYPHSHMTLVTQGEVAAFKGPRIQKHLLQALAIQGLHVIDQQRVPAVTATAVLLAEGQIAADVIIWAGGFVASPLAREAGIRVNERSQVLTDPFLGSLSHRHIYAVGDMAMPVAEPGAPIRMSLFAALVTGAQAADNIVAHIKGKTPQPLSFAWYGQAIALGPKDAVGFATYPADVPIGPVYRGKTAVALRNFFVWFLKAVLECERRFPGFLFWNGKKRFAQQQKRQGQAKTVYQQ